MPDDSALREQLIQLLRGGQAHATFDQAVRDFPPDLMGVRPPGLPYSAWELVEHLRLAQNDILRYSESAGHVSPDWPAGYWPKSPVPAHPGDWDTALGLFRDNLARFEALVTNPRQDLNLVFPWSDHHTLLREALVLADHNSYHLGQLVLVRRLLGAWPE